MDGVCTLVGGKLDIPVRLVKGTLDALKRKRLNAWISQEYGQQRGIKQYYITGSDGYLLVAIIVIKDSKIPTVQLRHWSNDGGYQLWTACVPNPKLASLRIPTVDVPTSQGSIIATAR